MKFFMKLLKDKKGSGIMTVMLAVLFLTAFGSLALYLTYTSFQVATSDRYTKEVTYNANTCMEEVKAGVQDIVSDSIIATYKEVMPNYIERAGDITQDFASSYFKNIVEAGDGKIFHNIEATDAQDPDTHEEYKIYSSGTYIASELESLIKEKRGYTCEVASTCNPTDDTEGNAEVMYAESDTLKKNPLGIVLRGIKVTFTGKNNRKASVIADIKIGVPNIGYLLTQYSIKGIPEFTMICTGALEQSATGANNGTVINGSAYTGSIDLSNNAPMLITGNATMICKGNIDIKGGNVDSYKTTGRFQVDRDSTLWAGNIEIGNTSSARLLGSTYNQNDLVFNGYHSYGELAGTYYGFGSDERNPLVSSSIISNSIGGELNMQFLDQLSLAGVSFITNGDRNNSLDSSDDSDSSARMGESLSGKLNQTLYYAPFGSVSAIKYQRPSSFKYDDNSNYDYLINDVDIEGDNTQFIQRNKADNSYKYFVEFQKDNNNNIIPESIVFVDAPAEGFKPLTYDQPLEPGESKVALFTKKELFDIHDFKLNAEVFETTGKRYSDYGIELKPYYKPLNDNNPDNPWDDEYAVYFMFEFADQEKANQFYIDTFKEDVASGNNKISRNLDQYLHMIFNNRDFSNIRKFTSGAFYTSYDKEKEVFGDIKTSSLSEIEALREEARFIEGIFHNYCKTLTNVVVEDEANNPFDYYINREILNDRIPVGGTMQFFNKTDLTAVIVNNKSDNSEEDEPYQYSYSATPNLHLIIATGDVNINVDPLSRPFTGLIICGGNITINGKATFSSDSDSVVSAYSADNLQDPSEKVKEQGDLSVKDFFRIDISKQYFESQSGAGDAWDVAALVTYDKWSRD